MNFSLFCPHRACLCTWRMSCDVNYDERSEQQAKDDALQGLESLTVMSRRGVQDSQKAQQKTGASDRFRALQHK